MEGSKKVKMLEDKYFLRSSTCENYSKFLRGKVDDRLKPFPIQFKDSLQVSYKDLLVSEFKTPFKFKSSDPLPTGLKIPPKLKGKDDNMYSYLHNIAKSIGEEFPVKLIEVSTQEELSGYEFGDYVNYLEKRDSENSKIINMISLELSKSRLSCKILGPEFVRKVDWIDQVWPLTKRMEGDYPCVQKYCLTGMGGSYTDFHIDFGGTSVWYHVVYGAKRFYVIKPTLDNLKKFEEWKPRHDVFFGDMVSECMYVDILPGETFMIPSGWIHAVYTPEDSIVFGGNFLHSFGIITQLQINEIETQTNVQSMYRFPYFKLLNWMLLCNLYPHISRAVDTGTFEDEVLTYFPVNKFLNPAIFQEVTVLVKICENWLSTSEHQDINDFEDASKHICRMNAKSLISEWWLLLQLASTCKAADSKSLGFICSELKQRKFIDVMDPTFFPLALDSQPADFISNSALLQENHVAEAQDSQINQKPSLKLVLSNKANVKKIFEDDESYDEAEYEAEQDEEFEEDEKIHVSKKRGRNICDDDDEEEAISNTAKAKSVAPPKKKIEPIMKILNKKGRH